MTLNTALAMITAQSTTLIDLATRLVGLDAVENPTPDDWDLVDAADNYIEAHRALEFYLAKRGVQLPNK